MFFNKRILCFFLLFIVLNTSKGNTLFISTDKDFYSHFESVVYIITQIDNSCNVNSSTVYLELISDKLEVVKNQIIKLKGAKTEYFLSLEGVDTGYYLIHIYTVDTEGSKINSSKTHLIGVDLVNENNKRNDKIIASIYPESGKAILDLTNRFAVFLENENGKPVKEKLLIRNKTNQLIAVCSTDDYGWGSVDVPIIKNEIISIFRLNGEILSIIKTDSN